MTIDRIKIDFNILEPHRFLDRVYLQTGIKKDSLREVAPHIRDDLKLNKCTKILDTYIFTKSDE